MSRWLVEKGGVRISVRLNGRAAEQLLEPMMADMGARTINKSHGIKLLVSGNEDEWQLHDRDSAIKRKIKRVGDLIYHLSDRIVFHIANNAQTAHCLHAAAVADGDRALIIPASSGSGKSTLTAWLVANGFNYLSDELILLEDDKISAVERPIQIKANGIDAVSPLLIHEALSDNKAKGEQGIMRGKLVNAVFPASLGGRASSASEHSLSAIVYPTYRQGSGFSFEQMSSAEAGMSMMTNHVNARNLEGHGFGEMMQLIRDTACYRLEYGGFHTLPTDFQQQLKTIMSSAA